MIVALTHIDNLSKRLLEHLQNLQNPDGSFTTYYLQEDFQPGCGWLEYPANSPFCTASTILPLLRIKSSMSCDMLLSATDFLKSLALNGKLWRFADFGVEYAVPYDSDSTALASFVLEECGEKLENKVLLSNQINTDKHYDLWLRPKRIKLDDFKVWLHNRHAQKCIPLTSGAIQFGDYEFTVTCNNLLYAGESVANKPVWENVRGLFAKAEFGRLYYPSDFNAIHAYSRAHFYNNAVSATSSSVTFEVLKSLRSSVDNDGRFIDYLLLAISILYLDNEKDEFCGLFEKCFEQVTEGLYERVVPLYCSNLHTDLQPDGNSPNTYFGSAATTCSLYLEFLNLYRYRFHGAFFDVNHA